MLLEELRREKDRIRRERERLRLQQQAQAQQELEERRRLEAELEEQRKEQEEQQQRQRERERDEQHRRKQQQEKEEMERGRPQQESVPAAVPPPPPPPPPPPAAPSGPSGLQDPLSIIEERIFRMHDLSARGDLTALQLHLAQHPEDYIAPDPRHSHCGLLHSAARGWQVEVLRHLSPTAMDVVSLLDAQGNNLIHHAAMGDSADGPGDQVATLRFLLGVLEESEDCSGSATSSSSSSSWSSKKAGRKSTRSSHVSFRFTSSAPSALISHAAYLSRSKETYQSMERAAQDMMSKTVKRSSLHGTSLNSNTLPSLAAVKGVLKAGWLNKR